MNTLTAIHNSNAMCKQNWKKAGIA